MTQEECRVILAQMHDLLEQAETAVREAQEAAQEAIMYKNYAKSYAQIAEDSIGAVEKSTSEAAEYKSLCEECASESALSAQMAQDAMENARARAAES